MSLAACRATTNVPTAGAGITVLAEPLASCRLGAPPPGTFTESAEAVGITFAHNGASSGAEMGEVRDYAGAGLGDLDGDGLLDLYLTNISGPDRVYLSRGANPGTLRATVVDVVDTGAANDLRVTLADVDGDRDLDALVSPADGNAWLENDGLGRFVAAHPIVSAQLDGLLNTYSVAVGDLDGNGWLDLFIGNHTVSYDESSPGIPAPELLFLNRGGGVLEEVSDRLPKQKVDDETWLVALLDFDDDGDLDLYEVNDAWSPAELGIDPNDTRQIGCRLYRNDGLAAGDGALKLTDVSDGSHADVTISAMGGAFSDFDGDGDVDLYVTTMRHTANALLRNDGPFQFSDVTNDLHADSLTDAHDVGWGAVFFDADMDGWEDLFVAHGWHTTGVFAEGTPLNQKLQPDVLLRNQGGARFQDVTDAARVGGPGMSRSPVVGDLNRDGFPDLVVAVVSERPYVYLNGCAASAPTLTVRLDDRGPNGYGVGARVRVAAGGRVQTRWLAPGSDGLYGSSAPELYFGFDATLTDTHVAIEVRWPDGETTTHADIPLRHRVTMRRR